MLLSLKAGGTGLTLTAANHVVHLDRWWNPAVENQATDRAFRIGQRRNVQVRKFVCPGTVEERIDEMITKKRALSEMVVGDGEGWLTELSTDTLRELFTLGADAVDEAGGRRCLTRTGGATPSRPGRARSRGGIQINSTRGAVARTWWSQRFIGVLEQIGVGGRLSRGRSYARAGQIVSLDVEVGAVRARCRAPGRGPTRCGSASRRSARPSGRSSARPWPTTRPTRPRCSTARCRGRSSRCSTAVGLTLFPASARDLAMDCTCPDHEVPCKHLAAVFYVLAERFDADPFEILALRGRDREALLEDLRARRAAAAAPGRRPACPPSPTCWTASSCAGPGLDAPLAGPRTPPDALLDQIPELAVRRARRAGHRPAAPRLPGAGRPRS